MKAPDEPGRGDDGEGLVLPAAGAVLGEHEACGAGTGLLAVRPGQAQVRAAPIVSAAGVGG